MSDLNLDAAIEAAARAIARAQGHDLGTMFAGPRARVEDDAEAAVKAALPILREQLAQEIALAIEIQRGSRCPECGGKPGGSRPLRSIPPRTLMLCGGGHRWQVPHSGMSVHPNLWCSSDAAELARLIGRGERSAIVLGDKPGGSSDG